MILSGTLRSTLDVFDEYEDADIVGDIRSCFVAEAESLLLSLSKFEALRRVHLIPSEDVPEETPETININVFRNLDSPVSEGGDNFSTGCVFILSQKSPRFRNSRWQILSEKQLLCMARAILKRSKVLVMDEVGVSNWYARASRSDYDSGHRKRRLCNRRAHQQNYPTVSSFLSFDLVATKHSMPVNLPLARYSLLRIDFVPSLITIG